MKNVFSKNNKNPSTGTPLSISIDKSSMEKVYYYLDNPPAATPGLKKILQKISREQQS